MLSIKEHKKNYSPKTTSHDCQLTFFLDHKLMMRCVMTPASPSLFAVPERYESQNNTAM